MNHANDVLMRAPYIWKGKEVLILSIIDPGFHALQEDGTMVVVYTADLELPKEERREAMPQKEIDISKLRRVAELVMSQLEVFEEHELRDWNKKIVAAIRLQVNNKSYKASKQYRVGDSVEWKDRQGITFKGVIEKINVKTVSLEPDASGTKWRIPYSFLEKVKGGSK